VTQPVPSAFVSLGASADTAATEPARPIIVQKYGGSSVADPQRLKIVAERVAATVRAGHRVVVVVSAMGKTTDELYALARAIANAPPRRELDMLLSSGERISMALLAMALHELGLDAISFTGSQSGILTNDRHSGARIIEVRPVRIQDELERDRVVIVAGFQGMSYKREVTTLGRGGSDTTAVALAAALQAHSCEIYSDVDGVYSADPRLVADARHLPEVSYQEMQELADHGAKVLNAQAVQWAQRAGIVIHARQTAGSPRQTRITAAPEAAPAHGGRATAVAATACIIDLMTTQRGAQALQVLAEHAVPLRHADLQPGEGPSGSEELALSASLLTDDVPDWSRTREALVAATHGALRLRADHGTVTAVGPGVGSDPALLAFVRGELLRAGLHPGRVATSPLRITLWLPTGEVAAATARVHELLCQPSAKTALR
jgi:aspartate kinase